MRSDRCPRRTTRISGASTTTTGRNSGCTAPWAVLRRFFLANERRARSCPWTRPARPRWLPSVLPTPARALGELERDCSRCGCRRSRKNSQVVTIVADREHGRVALVYMSHRPDHALQMRWNRFRCGGQVSDIDTIPSGYSFQTRRRELVNRRWQMERTSTMRLQSCVLLLLLGSSVAAQEVNPITTIPEPTVFASPESTGTWQTAISSDGHSARARTAGQ